MFPKEKEEAKAIQNNCFFSGQVGFCLGLVVWVFSLVFKVILPKIAVKLKMCLHCPAKQPPSPKSKANINPFSLAATPATNWNYFFMIMLSPPLKKGKRGIMMIVIRRLRNLGSLVYRALLYSTQRNSLNVSRITKTESKTQVRK